MHPIKLVIVAAALSLVQDSQPAAPITVRLSAHAPAGKESLRWSPKGAKVELKAHDGVLSGAIALGPTGTPATMVSLERTKGAAHFDTLRVDLDRDGRFSDAERITAVPKETRGKWWSSFETDLPLPVPADDGGATAGKRSYPLSLWYVEDPQEPDAAPLIRWSRRGWHEGQVDIGGKPAFVLITEMEMDGVFDQRDAWAIARDHEKLLSAPSRGLEQHVWFEGTAYRAVTIDPHGRSLTFRAFDPGITEAEEAKKADLTRVDRESPRAATPITFGKDLPLALDHAKAARKRILVDFETTWCGPCAQMNQFVYPAAVVADAAKNVVPVKVDGDEHRDLAKKYQVGAYPTIILLDADGIEIRRAVGYQSVARMVELLKP